LTLGLIDEPPVPGGVPKGASLRAQLHALAAEFRGLAASSMA
jgi:hypothetical protein